MIKNLFTSRIFLFIIIVFTAYHTYQNKRWRTLSIIHDDAINYYAYLPAAIIFHDLTFSFVDSFPLPIQKKIYRTTTQDNRVVQKMTMGVSVLLLPFFSLAHLYSINTELPSNGYSEVYEFSIAFAALFYFTLGMFFLRKSLKIYFTDAVVSITLVSVALATNLFYYTSYDSGMSHVYSFFLFSILLWLIIKWHEKPSLKFSVLTGLILGLITLIRPTNCIVIIFFAFYGITDLPSFWNKIGLFKKNWLLILVIGFFAFLPVSLQFMYWKFATGHWFYYSYGDEHFYFNNPHIWKGLFGFRKGLFIYTPVMILILPGIWFAFKQREKYSLAFIIFFIVNVYIIFSWWCWWYGGSFGCRPMVDSYALLALPLGAFFSKFFHGNLIKKIMTAIFITLFIFLNLFQIKQSNITILHWDGMNAKLYFKIFGTTEFPENFEFLVTTTDGDNALRGLPERDLPSADINKLILIKDFKVNIKGANNKFLSTDINKDRILICDRDHPYEWETFLFKKYVGDIYTIQSFENKYAGMDFNRKSKIFATKTNPGRTELFRIIDLNNNQFVLKAYDGSFVTLDKNNSGVLATGAFKITPNETFTLLSK